MSKKNIVVIAHDAKKQDLIHFLKERESFLLGRNFIATGRTADFIEQENFHFDIQHLKRGSSGGYNQITEMIKSSQIDLVIFFVDPAVKESFHPDIQELLDACVQYNTPFALNASSAELLIIGLIKLELSQKNK